MTPLDALEILAWLLLPAAVLTVASIASDRKKKP